MSDSDETEGRKLYRAGAETDARRSIAMQQRAWWSEDEPDGKMPATPQVDEPQPPRWSGLYNHRGEKLYLAPSPFGFRRR